MRFYCYKCRIHFEADIEGHGKVHRTFYADATHEHCGSKSKMFINKTLYRALRNGEEIEKV